MKVSLTDLKRLLLACGLDSAAKYDAERAAAKIADGIARFREPGTELEPADSKLFDKLVAAQADGGEIEVVDGDGDEPAAEPVAYDPEPEANGKPLSRKKAAKKSAKKAVKPKAPKPKATKVESGSTPIYKMSYEEQKRHYAKKPQPLTGRGAGVVMTLVELLREAGRKNKPITKQDMHAVLVEKFPDRDADKMWCTLNNRVPSYLNTIQGMGIVRDPEARGYYIPHDGKAAKVKLFNDNLAEAKKPKAKAAKKPAKKKVAK